MFSDSKISPPIITAENHFEICDDRSPSRHRADNTSSSAQRLRQQSPGCTSDPVFTHMSLSLLGDLQAQRPGEDEICLNAPGKATCWDTLIQFFSIFQCMSGGAAAAAMGTVAPPLTLLLLLLHLAEGSFPEEPSPLSYVPVEGMLCACARVRVSVGGCVPACDIDCMYAPLMNDSTVDVEVLGQRSVHWRGAALKPPKHTDKFKETRSAPLRGAQKSGQ